MNFDTGELARPHARLRLQSLNRSLSFRRLRPVRQNLQIIFISDQRLVQYPQLVQTDRQLEGRDCVVIFVLQRLSISVFGGAIILSSEIEIADLNVFRCPVWIPRFEFGHSTRIRRLGFRFRNRFRTLRMRLLIVSRGA